MYGNQEKVFQTSKKTSFSSWVAGIENWVIADVFALPVYIWNITGQVPYPGGIVIIWTQSCCCIPNSNHLHTPVVARE